MFADEIVFFWDVIKTAEYFRITEGRIIHANDATEYFIIRGVDLWKYLFLLQKVYFDP